MLWHYPSFPLLPSLKTDFKIFGLVFCFSCCPWLNDGSYAVPFWDGEVWAVLLWFKVWFYWSSSVPRTWGLLQMWPCLFIFGPIYVGVYVKKKEHRVQSLQLIDCVSCVAGTPFALHFVLWGGWEAQALSCGEALGSDTVSFCQESSTCLPEMCLVFINV